MKNTSTMLVDGTNLYKICFEGVKSYHLQRQNIHAIWGFLKKLRGLIQENQRSDTFKGETHPYYVSDIIVFWDGVKSGDMRRQIFPEYKEKRNRYFNGIDPYYNQKEVLKELLELIGIVNYSHNFVETDDCIAEYVLQHKDKKPIYILSNDHDYFQLIDKNIYVYYLNRIKSIKTGYGVNYLINNKSFEDFFGYSHKNLLLRKTIIGDESDNIKGANGFSEKSILNEIPQLLREEMDKDEILRLAKKKQDEKKKPSIRLESLISYIESGKFDFNKSLMDLKNPFITEDCKKDILQLHLQCVSNNTFDYQTFKSIVSEHGILDEIKKDPDVYGNLTDFLLPFKNVLKFKNAKRS